MFSGLLFLRFLLDHSATTATVCFYWTLSVIHTLVKTNLGFLFPDIYVQAIHAILLNYDYTVLAVISYPQRGLQTMALFGRHVREVPGDSQSLFTGNQEG